MYIALMHTKQRRHSSAFLATAVIVVILPFFAYLQYTWLGQLSEQEYQHMQNNLRAAAFHCSVEFSQQINHMMRSIGGMVEGTDDVALNEVRTRILRWKASASYSQIISGNVSFCPLPSPETSDELREGDDVSFFLLKNFSGILIPIKGNTKRAILIPFNTAYITSSLLPELIHTYFLTTDASEYEFIITDNTETPYFQSTTRNPRSIMATADIVVPFIMVPPFRPFLSRVMQQDRRQHLHRALEDVHIFDQQPHEQQQGDPGFAPHSNNNPRPRESQSNGRNEHSQMYIKHTQGSLETVVANNRMRNLGISFGILLLLGASVIFLVSSASRAAQLAQQQMEFVAGVSHELRTPLAVLKSAGENLADGVISEKDRTQKYGELIKSEVIRLSDMVEKALTYANIQSGKQQYEFHSVDIAAVLQKTIDEINRRIPKDSVTILPCIEQALPPVHGNEIALQSAFENILGNAMKYSDAAKWIKITTRLLPPAGQQTFIEIAVQDHGIGISPESLHKIFTPFYRGKNAIERQEQGSGLGLSITKHIVEAHGGTISVTSTLNVGSVFTILLPIRMKKKETT